MSNLINSFFSFDKLMKEKLVVAFFWLAVTRLALLFVERIMDAIGLTPIEWLFEFAGFFVVFLAGLVALRLICELAIALFRINDNISPDGGKSETADIDIINEALKAAEDARNAAEDAAKKATAATKSAVSRGKSDSKNTKPSKTSAADKAKEPEVIVDPVSVDVSPAAKKAAPKKPAVKKAAPKKPAAKKPAAKKPTVKKPAAKKAAPKDPAIKTETPPKPE